MSEKVTALIPTFNEEQMLGACLETVRWADEIFVVDSFSSDRTRDIAREAGARVLTHEYVNSAAQKNWAIPQALHPWVLLVDADERVTPALRDEIRSLLARGPERDGYWIRRANHFLGKRMQHGGWETDKVIRLFRRDRARYETKEVHAEIDLPGSLPVLQHPLLHYSFRGFAQYWRKMQLYSDWGASQLWKEGKRAGWISIGLRPVQRFLKMYVARAGFLDGIHGLVLAMLGAFSVFLKYAKLWEMGIRAKEKPRL
jgi:glycosyltransferase involved in cell wall biosynthesis